MTSIAPVNFATPLSGKETIRAFGVSSNGIPCGQDFLLTTAQIAALAENNISVSPAVTAYVSGGQTLATALTSTFNNITTAAAGAASVKLPASAVGLEVIVSNQGANAVQSFGVSPDTINGVATGTGISIPVGAIFVFTCAVVGNWLQNVQTGGAFTGTFDGVLGGNTPAAASVTTLAASSTASTTALTATATSNQLVLGTTRTLTLTAPTPASSSRTVTLPDPGGADSVAYLALAQTLTNKTLTGTFDGVLGGNTPAAASVTTLTASSTASATAVTATNTSNQLVLGTTRTLTLTAPTPASSSRTVTLPDPGGSDSVAYLALAQTLTNKTLTAPVIHTPPLAVGASATITAVSAGKTILLNTASGSVATLPAATGSGDIYYFVVTTTATSNAHKILAASGSDYMNGIATGQNANTAKVFSSAASTNHSIQMPFAGTQPSGGFIGDWFEVTDVATNLWQVTGMYQAGTTPTTPFSSATS